MDFIGSFSGDNLIPTIIVSTIFLAVVIPMVFSYRKQRGFKDGVEIGSLDIISYEIEPKVISLNGPLLHNGDRYYSRRDTEYRWRIEYQDTNGEEREYVFTFLETILPQDIVDTVNKGWLANYPFNHFFFNKRSVDRSDIVASWLLDQLPKKIIVKQGLADYNLVSIEDPLSKFIGQTNNNSKEVRDSQREKIRRIMWIIAIGWLLFQLYL